MLTPIQYILVALAAMAAGAVNALAGGGTLITFPTLTFGGGSPYNDYTLASLHSLIC